MAYLWPICIIYIWPRYIAIGPWTRFLEFHFDLWPRGCHWPSLRSLQVGKGCFVMSQDWGFSLLLISWLFYSFLFQSIWEVETADFDEKCFRSGSLASAAASTAREWSHLRRDAFDAFDAVWTAVDDSLNDPLGALPVLGVPGTDPQNPLKASGTIGFPPYLPVYLRDTERNLRHN